MDYLVRAVDKNKQVRIFAITSRELVEKAREIHNTSPVATAALGRLLSAGAMMGQMLKGEEELLSNFVNKDGKRYASYKNYEKELQIIIKRIEDDTDIVKAYSRFLKYQNLSSRWYEFVFN